jgi:uncharacterized membrane protein YbhN (UPF0104 family)
VPSGTGGHGQPKAIATWRAWIWVVIPLVFIGAGLVEWHATGAAVAVLWSARWYWVLAAGICAACLFLAGSACQQGAVLRRLPLRRLIAVQIASAVGNAGLGHLGGGYINVRFLRRLGMSRLEAVGAVSLNSVANASTHVLLLPLLVVILPDGTLPVAVPVPGGSIRMLLCLMTGLLVAGYLVVHRRFAANIRTASRRLAKGAGGLVRVWREPVRAVQLWSGALSTAFLHGAALYCMVHAVGLPLSLGTSMLVYLAASSASGLIPSPGGLGALDISLAFILAREGAPTPTLIAAIAGYRLMTSWLPLLPGTLTLGLLVRRKVI